MELEESYFFDTYAFYEIIAGNPNYKPYEKGIGIITTKLNLMELHYGILLLYGQDKADEYYNKFVECAVEVTDEAIKNANNFKMTYKIRKVSYIDCIGYTIAKMRGVKFPTGDEAFKDLDNVEFVK